MDVKLKPEDPRIPAHALAAGDVFMHDAEVYIRSDIRFDGSPSLCSGCTRVSDGKVFGLGSHEFVTPIKGKFVEE